MKKIAFILILLAGLIVPFACTNNQPTGPLATYNLTATFTSSFTPTATNWGGFTSTATPKAGTNTATPFTPGAINTATPTSTFVNTSSPSQPTPVWNHVSWSVTQPVNGVAYDGSATIYAAEGTVGSEGGLIQMFNTTGGSSSSLGTITTIGSVTFGQPNGVACYSNGGVTYIFVVDEVNNAVYEINTQNNSLVNSLTSFSSLGGGAPSSFLNPEGIAVDSTGKVYIADTGNDYVEVFSSNLATVPISEFGGLGSGNGQFNNPSAVVVDGSGNIYVADASNQRVQLFTSGFVYSSQFSTAVSASSDIFGITLDSSNNVYLADSGTSQIEEYSSSGTFITSGLGSGPYFPDPVGLTFLANNSNLLVADYANNQLYSVTP